MPFVIDASVTASWCFEDEHDPSADVAIDRLRADEALAPALWWVEIRNILIVNERRGRIAPQDADAFLDDVGRLPIRIEAESGGRQVMALARRHGLTAYDATYLGLAIRYHAPIATLDRALADAATAEGLELVR